MFGFGIYSTYWFHRQWRLHEPQRPWWAAPLAASSYVLSPMLVLMPVAIFFQIGVSLGSIMEGGDPSIIPGITGNQFVPLALLIIVLGCATRMILHLRAGLAIDAHLANFKHEPAPAQAFAMLGPWTLSLFTGISMTLWQSQLDATAS